MATLWTMFLEIFQSSLFWLTQFYGGQLAAAIVSLSLLARLSLLPLTVHLALRGRRHARSVKALQPRLATLRDEWKDAPERLASETMKLYRETGVSPVDTGVLKGSVIQAPVFIGLFHAVREGVRSLGGGQSWLWVTNLARPDAGVALLAAGLVGLGAAAGAVAPKPSWTLAIPAVSAGVMALTFSAGFGLYLAASGLIGTLQGLIVRRIEAGGGVPT